MIECYYALCQNHSCHHVPPGEDDGTFCGLNDCVVSEMEMLPMAIARQFDLYRMGVNFHMDGEHVQNGIKTLDDRVFATYNADSRKVTLSWVDQFGSQCVYNTDIMPQINIVDYAVRAMYSLGVDTK